MASERTDGDPEAGDPPLVVDIDGTLTGPDQAIDPRVMGVLQAWSEPVVVATGKSFPYPVALCEFLGIETLVVAENGGVVFAEERDQVVFTGDPEAADAVAADLRAAGHELGFGDVDLANRWRETEVAVSLDGPQDLLEELAADHGLEVVDTGFAYHVKSPAVDKGEGLEAIAGELGIDPGAFVAVGDSENDVSTFAVAGTAYAVANADERAQAAADVVTDAAYADGFLEAVEGVRSRRRP